LTSPQGKYDLFMVSVGDTERDVTEIIEHVRQNSALPIVDIAAGNSAGRPGQVQLEICLQPGAADAEDVRIDLDSYAGCMYQLESVEISNRL
jgi:hypothetical protein